MVELLFLIGGSLEGVCDALILPLVCGALIFGPPPPTVTRPRLCRLRELGAQRGAEAPS